MELKIFLRSMLRPIAAAATPLKQSQWRFCRFRSSAQPNATTKGKKSKPKFDAKEMSEEAQATDPQFSAKRRRSFADGCWKRTRRILLLTLGQMAGPSSPPLVRYLYSTMTTYTFIKFRMEELNETIPESLPMGMLKEFEASSRSAMLVRQSFLDLRDNFRRAADPSAVISSMGALPVIIG